MFAIQSKQRRYSILRKMCTELYLYYENKASGRLYKKVKMGVTKIDCCSTVKGVFTLNQE